MSFKDKKVSVQQYIARREEIFTRMNEVADLMEAEKRESTSAEKQELDQLKREVDVLDLRIKSADSAGKVNYSSREQMFDTYLREAINKGGKQDSIMKREFTGLMVADAVAGGIVPLTIKDIIQPLEEGLILSKIGVPLMTGLSGDYVWPVVGNVEASLNGEAVTLDDSKIDMKNIKPTPNRIGISIKITYQTITQTDGISLAVVKDQIPKGVTRLLNRIMFCTEAFSPTMYGPFDKATVKVKLTKLPTYRDFMRMKGKVLKTGIATDGGTFCFVMSEVMKAELEATPRNINGIGDRMILEDGKIGPYPVFCTNYINYTKAKGAVEGERIGFGNWALEPIGQFGDTRFIVDTVTLASEDAVKLTLNGDWSMTCLRKEGFAVMEVPAIGSEETPADGGETV